jgi:hypothetical protein
MYCPSCSTKAIEGAKFCKSCGMNLNIISQALTGSLGVADPLRDRDYKRARKEISEGINGSAIGAAFLVAAGLGFFLVPNHTLVYVAELVLALFGLVKLFRSVARILDAKVGSKLMDPQRQPRSTGALSTAAASSSAPAGNRVSQRLSNPASPAGPGGNTRPVAPDSSSTPTSLPPAQGEPAPARAFTGRVNREHSSPLRRPDRDEDLMAKLRN